MGLPGVPKGFPAGIRPQNAALDSLVVKLRHRSGLEAELGTEQLRRPPGNMQRIDYLMESKDEVTRQELKTDCGSVESEALWAGIGPGMRVADICCGPGKTSACLSALVQPGGAVVGIDYSADRIAHAIEHYRGEGVEFKCRDIREPLDDLGTFDFVWVRFVLEYCLSTSFELVSHLSRIVKPGGILCLIDLDHNCLSHYGIPPRLEKTLFALVRMSESKADFDPYAGRRLYSHLYRLGYKEIDLFVGAHLIFGELDGRDSYNLLKKAEVASQKLGFEFTEYGGRFEEFIKEFKNSFTDPGRFTYSPLIRCRGRRPSDGQ
jgi:SAM-dependent methyltransferase